MTADKPKIIAVIGPTASGKSDLAVNITLFIKKNAKKFGVSGAEIISADSRQVYKGLDIGSAKVPRDKYFPHTKYPAYRQAGKIPATSYYYHGIPHYLLSVANPKITFTAARYQKLADKAINQICKRGNIPILCGGTGLYIDSVIYGMHFPEVKPNTLLRKKLEKIGAGKLFEMLKKKDPKKADVVDRHNRRRLIRALEIIFATKKPIAPLKKDLRYEPLIIGIAPDMGKLKDKITGRLDIRLKNGLIKEVGRLHEKNGLSWKRLESFGLEYRFIAQFLQKKISKKEMEEKITNESRRYAKRQMTWFKRNKQIIWIKNNQKALKLVESFLMTL
jgi:tRNA dimethylallyltransferase